MTDYKKLREKDLKEIIKNRTEDPDELLDPEDIDVDASDVEVETKPETVAWEVIEPVYKENRRDVILDKDCDIKLAKDWNPLIRRKDVLKLIEDKIKKQRSRTIHDECERDMMEARKETLRDLKQKLKDGEE